MHLLQDLESIRDSKFSLLDEDFSSLDTRLLEQFSVLEIPDDWTVLGTQGSGMQLSTMYSLCVYCCGVQLISLWFQLLFYSFRCSKRDSTAFWCKAGIDKFYQALAVATWWYGSIEYQESKWFATYR